MRKLVLLSIVSALIALALPTPSGFARSRAAELTYKDPGVGGFMSDNLSYVATLPVESPGVSARVVQLGAQRRLYVSSAKDLAVYDVTNPAIPLLMGRLDTHNWENEDVAVSKDGKTVLMSDFEGVAYLIVIEVTDLPGGLVTIVPKGYIAPGGNHTIECVDDACNWAYGSEGKTYDLRDKANPKKLAAGWSAVTKTGSSGHHVTRDSSGLMWTDTTPIYALDPSVDPANPTIVAKSDRPAMQAGKTAYQHNNIRPFANLYDPRDTEEEQAIETLRPGEILLGEGETNFGPKCGSGSGPFATYSLRDFDVTDAAPFAPIEVFRPLNGQYDVNGDPAVNVMGCSGHWFDVSPLSTTDKIITANGWYDHGTRLFSTDGATGHIKQLGYFQPVVGAASAAYWVGPEYVYVIDYERGLDILHFDKDVAPPTQAEFKASWLAKLHERSPSTIAEQYFCALAQRGGVKGQARLLSHI
jgi:hypothetical protein